MEYTPMGLKDLITSALGMSVQNISAQVLPKGHDIEVVGESFHQDALRNAARANGLEAGVRPSDEGTPLQGVIFREPNNPHDSKAVKVGLIVDGQWAHVGYLPRETAAAFNPIMRGFEKLGMTYLGCEAYLIGGSKDLSFGTILNIASKRQVKDYLAALDEAHASGNETFRETVTPDPFDDDLKSKKYESELDWEVPGWIK